MSTCISRHGEYSSHVGTDLYCERCGAINETRLDAMRAVVDAARSVDTLLPDPDRIDVKHRDQLTSAMTRLTAALDALDAGGEGS